MAQAVFEDPYSVGFLILLDAEEVSARRNDRRVGYYSQGCKRVVHLA